jgi:hypothetical protein
VHPGSSKNLSQITPKAPTIVDFGVPGPSGTIQKQVLHKGPLFHTFGAPFGTPLGPMWPTLPSKRLPKCSQNAPQRHPRMAPGPYPESGNLFFRRVRFYVDENAILETCLSNGTGSAFILEELHHKLQNFPMQKPRADQSSPEQPRAAQSSPEHARAAQSSPEQPRAAQSSPKQPRDMPTGAQTL